MSLAYVYGFAFSLLFVIFGILWIIATGGDLLFAAFGVALILAGIRGVYVAGRRYWR